MSRHVCPLAAFFLAVLFSVPQHALGQLRLESKSFRVGVHTEYFSRALAGGDGARLPGLSAYLSGLSLGYELRAGFSLTLLLGYASSSYRNLIFRQLPFSVDFEGSGMGGFVVGAEAGKSIFTGVSYEIGVLGQFLACLGIQKEYDIPGLAVPGKVKASPSWMRASAGPVVRLTAWEGFTPYFYPCFHTLWGTFSMDQAVDSLEGEEKKEIKSKGQLGLLAGTTLDLSPRFQIKAEAGLYPRTGGSDYSVTIQALFGF